ncbi:Probable licABCH operon regulator [uncultured Clostridium sp.]|uniref:BglG family transcription antiterminator n=1 Tax=uncultured Clostridium sp. TaxID=59620 RepID=UPI000821A7C9|nr:HTH domain-containing protein [uncultured Clostridium sp.]SCK02227.1 Probable licABCH operon regulator [uncultured Clostridium sp.]
MFTKRQTNILEIILKNTSGITGSNIGEKLSVSSRTIRNDISQINSLLSNDNISVSSSHKSGYFLKNEYIDKLKEILNNEKGLNSDYHLDDHRDFVILGKILFEGKQNIYDLSEILFVSTRTVYKVIKGLQESMANKYFFNGIKYEKEYVFIEASEEEIRKLLFKIVSISVFKKTISLKEVQIIFDDNFSLEELNFICNKVKKCFIDKKNFVDEEYIIILSWLIYIAQIRTSNGFLNKQSTIKLTDRVSLQTIDDLLKAGINLNENDVKAVYKFLWTKKLTSENKISETTKIIFEDFIAKIKERYHVDLGDNDNFLENLLEYMEYMLRRIESEYQFVNAIKGEIKNRYPFAYEISMLIVDIVYKYFNKYPVDDEVANIAIYLEPLLHNFNYKTKLLMITDSRVGINGLIQRWINDNFYNKVEIIGKVSLNELKNYETIDEAEVIVSPINIEKEVKVPTCVIESIPDNNDIQRLKQLMHRVNVGNKFEDIIKKYFDESLIDIYDDEYSLHEVIVKQAKKFKELGYISNEKKFVDDVLAREREYPTVIGESVMLPRPIRFFSEKILISVVLLKKPIYYKEKNIRILFLSTQAQKASYDLNFLFELFKRVALNKCILRSLIDLEDKSEFLQAFIDVSKNIK